MYKSKANEEGYAEQTRVSAVPEAVSAAAEVPVVDFQVELRQAFLAETPRGC